MSYMKTKEELCSLNSILVNSNVRFYEQFSAEQEEHQDVKIITSISQTGIKHLFPGQPVLASQVDPGPQVVIVQVEIFSSQVCLHCKYPQQAPIAMTAFPRIRFGEHPVNTICPNCQNQVSGEPPPPSPGPSTL